MLTEHHRQYLAANAIDVALAEAHGVESVEGGLVFPYRNPSGRVVQVFRPDDPGDGPKYRSPEGQYPGFNLIVPEGDTLLLVEGTKQALAAASYIGADVAVAGLNGCWGFRHRVNGTSDVIPDLDIVADRHVVIALDADYTTNPDVKAAGEALTREARARGALSVRRLTHDGQGSEGLDDVLARFKDPWRVWQLQTWIDGAQEMPVPPEPEGDSPPFLDFAELFNREDKEDPWLLDNVLARGKAHAFVAKYGNQKSLFAFWIAVHLVQTTDNVDVLYLDYEMDPDEILDRLESMGVTQDNNLSDRLHYWLWPDLQNLDTAKGGQELVDLAETLIVPGRELLVIVDTLSRTISAGENDSDMMIAFATNTVFPLKRLGVTFLRLDHAGKDLKKAARGTSAKGDDVDVVWLITKDGQGITLEREKGRSASIEQRLVFQRQEEPILAFRLQARDQHPHVQELINLMDEANIPLELTRAEIEKLLPDAPRRRKTTWLDAIRARRQKAEAL